MRRRLLGRIGFYLLVAAIIFYAVFPFYWAVVSSLKSGSSILQGRVPAQPSELRELSCPVRRAAVRTQYPQFAHRRDLRNAISLVLAVTAAYALGRIRFRGRTAMLLATLSVSMFPQIAVLSGMFELIRLLGLYNTLTGLVLSYLILTLPFTAWVLTAFMRELPRELEEAAIIDGASSPGAS